MLPLGLMLVVCAPEIVAVVSGAQWDAAIPVLRILAVGTVFWIGGIVNMPVTRAMGALGRVAWRQAACACPFLSAVAAGCRWGLGGVAAATVGALVVSWLAMTQLTLSLLGLGWRVLFRHHLPALWARA